MKQNLNLYLVRKLKFFIKNIFSNYFVIIKKQEENRLIINYYYAQYINYIILKYSAILGTYFLIHFTFSKATDNACFAVSKLGPRFLEYSSMNAESCNINKLLKDIYIFFNFKIKLLSQCNLLQFFYSLIFFFAMLNKDIYIYIYRIIIFCFVYYILSAIFINCDSFKIRILKKLDNSYTSILYIHDTIIDKYILFHYPRYY